MINREKFLLVFGYDYHKWAMRYNIEPISHPRYKCGVAQVTSIPFAYGVFRGLVAPVCECGHPTPPYSVVKDCQYEVSKDGSITDLLE